VLLSSTQHYRHRRTIKENQYQPQSQDGSSLQRRTSEAAAPQTSINNQHNDHAQIPSARTTPQIPKTLPRKEMEQTRQSPLHLPFLLQRFEMERTHGQKARAEE
jgi:hypothetical protein